MLCFFNKISSSLLPGMDKTKQVYKYDQGRGYQKLKFHDPKGRGSAEHRSDELSK